MVRSASVPLRGRLAALAFTAALLSSAAAGAAPPLPSRPRYVFQDVGDKIGFATREIYAVAQDRAGFLWLGTADGLFRYDGEGVTRFGAQEGLPSAWITEIKVSERGTLWLRTLRDLVRFDGRHFVPLTVPRDIDLKTNRHAFALQGESLLYLATPWGLVRFDLDHPGQHRVFGVAEGLPAAGADTVLCAPDGNVWFVSGGRVGWLDPVSQRVQLLARAEGGDLDEGIGILRDGAGTLWIRTEKRLYRVQDDRLVREPVEIPESQHLGRPSVDRAGNLLVPTVAGLYRRLDGGWENVGELHATGHAAAEAIEDREGAYWLVGADTLLRWPGPRQWKGWSKAEGLPDDNVWSVLRDRRDRLWVGTNNGVAMWDPASDRWRAWNESTGLAAATVSAMIETPGGAVIVLGYPGGLTRFDPRTLEPSKVPTARTGYQIVLGPEDRIWFRAESDILTFPADQWPPHFEKLAVPDQARPALRLLARAPDGAIWGGSSGAVASFFHGTWRTAGVADGLLGYKVSEMAPVDAGETWLHYNEPKGLARVRFTAGKTVVEPFTEAQGLASDHVSMMGRDRDGQIWAGGEHGLTRIGPAGARRYSREDGLLWDSIGYGAFWLDRDGGLFVGTTRGVAHLAAPGAEPPPPPLDLRITSLMLGGRERIGEPEPWAPYQQRRLQVRFSAPTFRDPKAVRCRYRLLGFESAFNETTQREVIYPSLPSRAYVFEVSCRSSAGVWSKVASQRLTIQLAWWQRWWFRGLCSLAGAGLLWSVVWLRTRQLESERRRLEEAVQVRSGQLASANQDLAAANATLEARNGQMRLVLDNVEQGFITIDRQAVMAEERSAAIDRWFGPSAPGRRLADHLAPLDPSFAERFELGWPQVVEGTLPLALAIEQLPARLTAGERAFAVSYRPIAGERGSEAWERMLVVTSDITAQLAQEEREREQREVLVLVQHLVADRAGVEHFREDGGELVARICAEPPPPTLELKRLVHTLKGNAGIFGLARLADRCQMIESQLDLDEQETPAGLAELRARWREVDRMLAAFLGAAPPDAVELRQDDLSELQAAIDRGAPPSELRAIVTRWSLEPTAQRLRRIAEQVQRLGRSLNKGDIRVVEEPNNLRLPEERWSPFWTALIHIVRNAVDHGVEARDERLAAGKPEVPTVWL
ncbi:MAG TPA: two-component regulator propeller domain-containing protein, partial [Polyangia bacterium]|nr:two-component regulator propeller domain-containing protein [Polyangia bacterium]